MNTDKFKTGNKSTLGNLLDVISRQVDLASNKLGGVLFSLLYF